MLIDIQENPRYPLGNQEAVGIDFGTTFCAVALCQEHQKPQLLGPLIPSVVAYEDHHVLTGACAQKHPHGWRSIKRLLTPQNAFQPLQPLGTKTAYQCAIDLWKSIAAQIRHYAGREITQAVVSVPAYFDESQRQIIKNAATEAGFQVLRLISEPTAAALYYTLQEEGIYGVYDLGGGTFDFSVMTLRHGIFRVIATGGHAHWGGDDIDHIIAQDQGCTQEEARQLKEQDAQFLHKLSSDAQGQIKDFFQKTIQICIETLAKENLTLEDLRSVLLVGGSTKMQSLQSALRARFPSIDQSLHPDYAVAMGAAVHAYNLTHASSFLLLDIVPLSLGLETLGGLMERIIPRHTPLPTEHTLVFTNAQDGQKSIKLHILQGEQELAEHCRSLGVFHLTPLPYLRKGQGRIHVTFRMDSDGLLKVSAEEKLTGTHLSVDINAYRELSQDIVQAQALAEGDDLAERMWIQKVQQAQESLTEVRRLLVQFQHDTALEQACTLLEEACASHDLARLINTWEEFTKIALPFIEQYLTHTLKSQLEPSR